jgi:lipopolysaccharide export system permease protein
MRRTLSLYLAQEILGPTFLGLVVFTFVLLMFQLLRLTELVVTYGVSLRDVGRLIVYLLPPFFVFTVPMSFLLGVMLAFARLSADSELTALRASGVSLYQMYPVVGLLSVATALVAFVLTVHAEPWGKKSLKQFLFELTRSKATLGYFKPHVFNTDFDDLVIYVSEIDPVRERIRGVFVRDTTDPNDPKVVLAREGELVPNPYAPSLVLRLVDGSIHRARGPADAYEVADFARYDMGLALSDRMLRDAQTTYLEMSLGELGAHVDALRKGGDDYALRRAWVEYHKKFAFPCAALIFGFLGVPLAIAPVRSGRSRGFAAALAILVVYYLLFRAGETIGWRGGVHPAVVMWAPNVLLGGVGAFLFVRKAGETDVQVGSRLAALGERLRGRFGGGRR